MALQDRAWPERYAQAQRHVLAGLRTIGRQRALINRQRASGRDTRQSEELLAAFEQSQSIFEDDLVRIGRGAR